MSIKIGSTGATKSVRGSSKSKKTSSSSSDFSSFLEETSSASTSGISATTSIGGIDVLLAAQGVGDSLQDEGKKKRAIAQGNSILDKLEDLRASLLLGEVPKSKLIVLAQELRNIREKGLDSELETILDEIELRAEVEIAKLANGI